MMQQSTKNLEAIAMGNDARVHHRRPRMHNQVWLTDWNVDMATADELYAEGDRLKKAGDLEAAIAAWRELLTHHPDHGLAHSALAVHLQKLGQVDEAINHALRVTELEPNDAFSFMQLSVIYQRCGRIPEAEFAMTRAQEIEGSRS
jgi:Flp pilus assembly protein TadD